MSRRTRPLSEHKTNHPNESGVSTFNVADFLIIQPRRLLPNGQYQLIVALCKSQFHIQIQSRTQHNRFLAPGLVVRLPFISISVRCELFCCHLRLYDERFTGNGRINIIERNIQIVQILVIVIPLIFRTAFAIRMATATITNGYISFFPYHSILVIRGYRSKIQ